ncbi:MAG: hypothetical protein EHM72_09995 [Calditrichaeota bacterium]|nr:MAG: hypothetical protein EHM72_09995 [Calditrichota bacterium]
MVILTVRAAVSILSCGAANKSFVTMSGKGTDMNKSFGVLIVIPVCIFLSCAAKYAANYDIGLCEVQRPEDAKAPYGKMKLSRSSGSGNFKLLFEDDKMKIVWLITTNFIGLDFYNKTDRTINIIWGEAAFIDTEGVCRRLMHRGEKPSLTNRQMPTVVMRKGSVSDVIIPVDYAQGSGRKFGEMQLYPVLPELEFSTDEISSASKDLIGKKIQILLPFQIEGVVNEYVFSFIINNIIINGKPASPSYSLAFQNMAENNNQADTDNVHSDNVFDYLLSDTIVDSADTSGALVDSSLADIKAVYQSFLLIYVDRASVEVGDFCSVVRKKENELIELGKAKIIRIKDNKAALEFKPEEFTSIPNTNDMVKYFK